MWDRWLPDLQWRPGLVWQWGVWKSSGRDTAWHLLWWSLSSMDWDSHPGRAWAEQRCPQRGQGVFLIVEVLALAIKHILLPWTGENSWAMWFGHQKLKTKLDAIKTASPRILTAWPGWASPFSLPSCNFKNCLCLTLTLTYSVYWLGVLPYEIAYNHDEPMEPSLITNFLEALPFPICSNILVAVSSYSLDHRGFWSKKFWKNKQCTTCYWVVLTLGAGFVKLELFLEYRSFVETYVDLGTIFANAAALQPLK